MRTICAKFPRYSFEDLLDKTPAWINWTALQAVSLDGDMMEKVNMVLSGIFGGAAAKQEPQTNPKSLAEQMMEMKSKGFNVRRE